MGPGEQRHGAYADSNKQAKRWNEGFSVEPKSRRAAKDARFNVRMLGRLRHRASGPRGTLLWTDAVELCES